LIILELINPETVPASVVLVSISKAIVAAAATTAVASPAPTPAPPTTGKGESAKSAIVPVVVVFILGAAAILGAAYMLNSKKGGVGSDAPVTHQQTVNNALSPSSSPDSQAVVGTNPNYANHVV
jgi:hypothetical protein